MNGGSHFYWLNGTQEFHKSLLGHNVDVPPMFDSIYLLIGDMIGFFVVACGFFGQLDFPVHFSREGACQTPRVGLFVEGFFESEVGQRHIRIGNWIGWSAG